MRTQDISIAFAAEALAGFAVIAALSVFATTAGVDWIWPDRVTWRDEFLGTRVRPEYNVSLFGEGSVGPSSSSALGGWMELSAPAGGKAIARIRLGEDPGTSDFDFLPWSAKKNLVATSRIRLNRSKAISATVGFVGNNDPNNAIAALYVASGSRAKNHGWVLQTSHEGKFSHFNSEWSHTADQAFVIEIRAGHGVAALYIDGKLVARTTHDVTPNPLSWEFQVWNDETEEGWSDAQLYVDYLFISQDR